MSVAIDVNTPLVRTEKPKKEKTVQWARAIPICILATVAAGWSLSSGKISLPGLAALEIAEKTLKTIGKRSPFVAGAAACGTLLGSAYLADQFLGTELTPAALKIFIVTLAGGNIKKFILSQKDKESKQAIQV